MSRFFLDVGTGGRAEQTSGGIEHYDGVLVGHVLRDAGHRAEIFVTKVLAHFPELLHGHLLLIDLVDHPAGVLLFGECGLLETTAVAVVEDRQNQGIRIRHFVNAVGRVLRPCPVKVAFAFSVAANATFTGGEEGVLSKNSTASIKADSLTVSGDKNALNFDKDSSLTLANKTDSQTANTTLNGNVTIAGSATFKNQDINQTAGTFHVSTLDASNSKLTFNTTENGGVTVGTLTGDLKLEAGASVTEKLGSAEKVAEALKTIIGGNAADQLKENFVGGEASDMTGAWTYDAATGDVSYQGSRLSPTLTAVTHANAANLAQWRYEVNHLSERLGDVRSQNGALGAWARVYGTDAKVSDSVSTKFTNNTIQVGGDAKVGDTWIVGAAFGYTDNSTDFSNGSADSDGYTLSVYGTAVLPSGSYLDLIGRVGRISTDIDVSTVTPFKASYDNTTVGLSAEVGHRFDLSQIFYVTPQAELAYGRVFGDDYSGSNGMKVSQDDFDTLIARIGFQAGANFADNRGSIYLTASVNHDFLGDTEATASKAGAQDQKLKEDLGGTWFSYGIGAQFSTTNNLSFYGSLTRANGSDYQEDYHYSVGARYVF